MSAITWPPEKLNTWKPCWTVTGVIARFGTIASGPFQFTFDVPVFARWMEQVRDLGLDKRCYIIAGVGPIRSLKALELLKSQYVDACRRDVRTEPVDGQAEQREEDLALQLRDLEQILGSLERLSAFVRHVSRSVPRFRRPLRSSRAPLR